MIHFNHDLTEKEQDGKKKAKREQKLKEVMGMQYGFYIILTNI